ncbi:calcium-binding protein [Phenylobacterium kunshanense]|uniref:Calcium-binding protein n=1 Tax=Phenylobacterium kunshanense TaxID=1445034 RepID=A0A328BEV5_9CAUL|nr:calcium-binding protein [Phenylobacterium kunshanense]RAK65487.1 calcium-binding protein [Phenylobacterium kunshanense]
MAIITGTDSADTLRGTAADDRIVGNAGNDRLEGGGGNDFIDAGAGNDTILATDTSGNTQVSVDGGAGDDCIYVGGPLTGGGTQSATVIAGAGNDEINHLGQFAGGIYDGGDGDDDFRISTTQAAVTLRLGSGGHDIVYYTSYAVPWTRAVLRVEQFRSGDGGDEIRLGLIEILKGWDQSNPFAGGYLRLSADGLDTLIQVDEDGGGDGFQDFVRLVGVAPGEVVAANLNGYSPDGAETIGRTFVGTSVQIGSWVQIDATIGADTITGQGTADLILAYSGNDLIFTNAGNDRVHSGYGDDTVGAGSGNDTIIDQFGSNYLRGDDGNDSIAGGAGFDDINGNMGADTASGGLGQDWVVGGKDNDLLSGDAGNDLVYGNLGADTCDGGDGNDIVRGGQDNDSLSGGAGDDYVSGDKGDDTVAGGAGADLFHTFGDAGIDRVIDFSLADGDRVQLDPGTQYTVAQVGADTVISMTGGGQMVLVGVQMSALPQGWIFGA